MKSYFPDNIPPPSPPEPIKDDLDLSKFEFHGDMKVTLVDGKLCMEHSSSSNDSAKVVFFTG